MVLLLATYEMGPIVIAPAEYLFNSAKSLAFLPANAAGGCLGIENRRSSFVTRRSLESGTA